MAVVSHGIDLVVSSRIAAVLDHHGQRFLDRLLTPAEQERARRHRDCVPFVAGRWAAKEAILKVIGTGWRGKIAWRDMEILPDVQGQPIVTLSGEVQRKAAALGIQRILLSITHTKEHAAASALGVDDA